MRVIDLSLPIVDHFRWRRTLSLVQSHEHGDIFRTSKLELLCHAFTHADAPVHFTPGGAPLGGMPLSTWVGRAAVVDLSDCGPLTPITRELLESRAQHLERGGIALLRTSWDTRTPIDSPDYWADAPYVTSEAAQWMRSDRDVRCVGFDFPQDEGIRALVAGGDPQRAEFTTHEVLLSQGVGMLEYLTGLDRLENDHTFVVAAPLSIPDADGSPVRALALEEM